MNEQDFTPLVERWFAGEANEDDVARLEQWLVEDPTAAERLARQARIDAALRSRFRTERRVEEVGRALAPVRPAATGRSARRTLWAAVVVSVAIGAFVYLRRGDAPQPNTMAEAIGTVVDGRILVAGQARSGVTNGETLTVANDAPADLRLRDGSHVTFAASASAAIRDDVAGERLAVELNQGRGTFRVMKGARRFRVETSVGSVTALGTEFSVELIPDPPRADRPKNRRDDLLLVEVASGIVEVEYGRHKRLLAGGEAERFRDDHEPSPPRVESGRFHELDEPAGLLRLASANERPRVTEFRFAPEAAVEIDGRPATLGDLRPRMRVSLTLSHGGTVVAAKAFGPTVTGTLRSVDEAARTITLVGRKREGGRTKDTTYRLADEVRVTGLEPGQRVKLEMSADESAVVRVSSE